MVSSPFNPYGKPKRADARSSAQSDPSCQPTHATRPPPARPYICPPTTATRNSSPTLPILHTPQTAAAVTATLPWYATVMFRAVLSPPVTSAAALKRAPFFPLHLGFARSKHATEDSRMMNTTAQPHELRRDSVSALRTYAHAYVQKYECRPSRTSCRLGAPTIEVNTHFCTHVAHGKGHP